MQYFNIQGSSKFEILDCFFENSSPVSLKIEIFESLIHFLMTAYEHEDF